MKKILNYIMLSVMLTATLLSCEKDENKIFLEGGTPPVLTSVTSNLILLKDEADKPAISFTWTNPNYQFNTGISSQDVTYLLEVDTAGANFTSPTLQQVSISKDLSVAFTEKELNTVLTKLNVLENIEHTIEFRIRASLLNNSAVLYSNVIQHVIIPYLDVAVPIPPTNELFITGDGTPSGWTNTPPEAQQCERISNVEYSIVMTFSPGLYYKFLTNQNQWQPQYGLSKLPGASGDASSGDLGFNFGTQGDPDAIPTPAAAGTYKVTINFKTGKYTAVKQ